MIVWETNNLYEYLKGLYDQDHANMADFNGCASAHLSSRSLLGATSCGRQGWLQHLKGPLAACPPVCWLRQLNGLQTSTSGWLAQHVSIGRDCGD